MNWRYSSDTHVVDHGSCNACMKKKGMHEGFLQGMHEDFKAMHEACKVQTKDASQNERRANNAGSRHLPSGKRNSLLPIAPCRFLLIAKIHLLLGTT